MKKKFRKKALAAVIAAACSVNGLVISNFANAATNDIYEFESGTLSTPDRIFTGQDRDKNPVEASGGSFVFLQDAGETASVEITVEEAGMYNLAIAAYTPYGSKTHTLLVNGVDQGQISFAENKTGFSEVSLGIFKLNKGTNTVTVKSSWGWTYIDYLKVTDASFPSLDAPKVLSDKKATDETKRLMCYLRDVYGSHIISGQQEIYKYGPHEFEYEFDYIKNLTGKLPAIRGFDYLNECNILYGSEDGTTDRMIDWAKKKGGIITASWHVTVPKDFTNFTLGETNIKWEQATYGVWADDKHTIPATDFDTSQILVEGSKEREYWMACLDKLASSIKRLQDENIPIILRPLHEAEGGGGENGSWFFWGQDGSEVYKGLWRLTYDTLVNDYDLHNIIWEWNSYAYETSADWYPGDDYVDLVAYDKYNCTDWSTGQRVLNHNDSAITSTFYTIVEKYGSKKMVAMAENDSIPTLENLTSEKAGWLYFCPWYDGTQEYEKFLTNPVFNTKEDLTTMYQSDYCITLDELPENLYTSYSLDGFGESQSTTDPTEPVTTQPTEPTITEPVTTEVTEPTEPTTTEPVTTEVTEPTEPVISTEPLGVLSINSLPEKLEYDADSVEVINYTDLKVSLDYYYGENEHDVIYDNVSPSDYPDVFIVDDSEVKRTTPGTYTVTVKCADDIAGQYWVANNQATFEITITGGSDPTIEFGTPSLVGDADLDGKVGISDVVKVAKFISSSTLYPLKDSVAAANADVNKDKAINPLDLSEIIEYLLNRITEF